MKKSLRTVFAGLVAGSLMAGSLNSFALGLPSYNQNLVTIMGTGNPDPGWNLWTDTALNIQLGLRAKDRSDGTAPNDGLGTYYFSPGSYAGPIRTHWNWEFSINTDPANGWSQKLVDFDFYLSASGPSWSQPTINLLTAFADNSYGNNTTVNGAGVEGLAAVYAPILNIAQNSQNPVFTGADVNATGNYLFLLYMTAPGAGPGGAHLAEVGMTVNVSAVPEPSSLALVGVGSLALVQRIRRRR